MLKLGASRGGERQRARYAALDPDQHRLHPPLAPPPFAKSAHVGRKPQRVPYHPDQKVAGRKGDDKKHGKQIERDLGAPRMEHEQGVAVVGPPRERKRNPKREPRKQPQQAPHRPARPRAALYPPSAANLTPPLRTH